MRLNDFFGRVCYINLDRRKDRFKRMEYVLDANDICSMRVPGIEGNAWKWKSDKYPHPMRAFDGVAGGTSTQIDIITFAMKDKRKSVLILEDDIDFVEDFSEKFDRWSKDVPDDWDLLYLGGMNGEGLIYMQGDSGHVFQVTNMMATHAYAVSERAYGKVLDAMYDPYPYLLDSADGYLRKLQRTLNAYAFNPPMVWQIGDYSDIQHGHRDYVAKMKKPLI